MDVFIISIALLNVSGEAVNGKVHLAEPDCLGSLFLTVDHDLAAWSLLVPLHKFGALDEHAAGATGRVKDPTVERLDYVNDKFDNGGGSEELASLFPFAHGELSEEILVNLPEHIALDIHGYA